MRNQTTSNVQTSYINSKDQYVVTICDGLLSLNHHDDQILSGTWTHFNRIKWVSSLASYFISIQIRGRRCHPRMMLLFMQYSHQNRNTMHIHWICLCQITTSMQHMFTSAYNG
eukprot:154768_1